ncbi:MAG: GNAT family N-acetyltransferase [Chloroflexi bacterium]|nr:GNAT family N-acetyltransferase [Chloroflexota bacterium]
MLERSVSITRAQPLTTARLVLRPYEEGDLAFLADMFGREDVARYLPWPPMDEEAARAKLEQRLRQASVGPDSDAIVTLAVETATGRSVGEFMLRVHSPRHLQGEIGWSVHPDFQGLGFATEGARAMLRLGFDVAGLHRIAAECDPRNTASIRVMEKLGMRREALLVEAELIKGEWVDSLTFAQLESEWRASGGGVAAG